MNLCKKSLIVLLVSTMVAGGTAGCASSSMNAMNMTARLAVAQSVELPERWPVLLAAYQAWFGVPGHAEVGYSSVDRVMLEKQIQQAKQMGIAGFVINWYGPAKDFEDRSYSMLQDIASKQDFKVALLYDEDSGTAEETTERTISDLQYAYTRYIGPTATYPRSSYLTYQGRPVIFIFPKTGKTDWGRVREVVDQWAEKPLLIYKDNHTKYASAFDGYYAWVAPGEKGWSPDGSNWGQEYLEGFYKRMTSNHPDKIAVGAAWPGFDDTKASWTRNRKMDGRCGKTFDESLRAFRRYFSEAKPLPFLVINTWNDYEEGTAIERGIDRCHKKPTALAKQP